MTWCLFPHCLQPQNPDNVKFCLSCGAKMWLGDRYHPLKPLGHGGFGRTFLSVDEHIPSRPRCVIKQFFPQHQYQTQQQAEKAIQLFQQEAMRLDELGQHPQIPKLLAHFTEEPYQYLVQTFVDGQTLAQEMAQIGMFDPAQIRQILQSLLPVLQFVHDHQVIHRDIKPENIIRRRTDGQLVLVDFGASKFVTHSNINHTGTVIGSAGYSAPEQVGGKATFASDIYSLGVTCIYLLTGIPPFDLFSFTEGTWIWRNYLQKPVEQSLAQVLDRMLEPAINRRYASAAATLQDLASDSPSASSAVSVTPAIMLAPSRRAVGWQCVCTLCEHDQSVAAIAIHPNGTSFASASFDKTIQLWHLSTGTLLNTFKGHSEPVTSVIFSPDGRTLVSGSVDDTIKLWDLQTESLHRTISDHSDSILSLSIAVSPDGQAIASGSDDNTIRIWQLGTGRLFRTLPDTRAITCIAFSPNGNWLASGSGDNTVKLWNISTGKLIRTLIGHTRDINAIAFHPNGHLLISGSSDNTLRIWNFQTNKVRTLTGHLDWVKTVAISPDGEAIASGAGDHSIKLWRLSEGKLQTTLVGHTRDVNALAFSPDGKTLVSGGSDRTIKIWRNL